MFENVAFPLREKKLPHGEITEKVKAMLAMVALTGFEHRSVTSLSGGQQQRVAIARALAMYPKVLLCDEITSALDPELVGEVLKVIAELAKEGLTIVLVTHEMAFARDVADRVVFMYQGKIHEEGPAREIFAHPKTPELTQFISRVRSGL